MYNIIYLNVNVIFFPHPYFIVFASHYSRAIVSPTPFSQPVPTIDVSLFLFYSCFSRSFFLFSQCRKQSAMFARKATVRVDASMLIPFNPRDFLRDPDRGRAYRPAHCNNLAALGGSVPQGCLNLRLRPRNTMDGSGGASSVQCLHYDHPRGLAHVTILILTGFVSLLSHGHGGGQKGGRGAGDGNKN